MLRHRSVAISLEQPAPAVLSPSTSISAFTSLFDVDTAPSSPLSSPSSLSHVIDIVRPCRLLAAPTTVRSMMLDYLDDRSTLQCLNSCQSLHAGYHQYPLKRAMSVTLVERLFKVDVHFRYRRHLTWYYTLSLTTFGVLAVVVLPILRLRGLALALFLVLPCAALLCGALFFIVRLCISRRKDCCARGWRLDPWRGHPVPRVQKLNERLWKMQLLPCLQHLTELTTAYDKKRPFGTKNYPLPRSLRTLTLENSPDFELKSDTLPPRLTSLSLSVIKSMPLPVGVLSQSLTSLHLTYCFDTSCGIEEGVLPSSLVTLRVDEWKLPLSHIALPASLIEVDVRLLHDHPLPVLPSQLEELCLGGAFNQPLIGVLPSSLRVLRLRGLYDQQLTEKVFESIPQLEELYLSDLSPPLAGSALPRSQRVLRVSKRYTIRDLPDMPRQLRRLLVPARSRLHVLSSFEQFGRARCFTIEWDVS